MSIFAFALLIIACSPKQIESKNESLAPLLSMQDILKAPDFKERVSQAVRNKDTEALRLLQNDVLSLAKQARLSPKDIAQLGGNQGLVFLEFQGKLINYDREFMARLTSFQDLNVLFDSYPSLTSLHQYSKDIERQRDLAIQSTIDALKEEGVTGDLESIARVEWLKSFVQNQN